MTVPQSTFPSPVDALGHTRSFRELDRPTLETLVAAAQPYRVAVGSTLFRAGEPFGNVVYILYAGRMRQRRLSGEEHDVQRGDWLGLANYLDRAPFTSTVEALTDCALLGIAAETLDRLERDCPSLFNCLQRIITSKLRARNPVHAINRGGLAQPVRSVMTTPGTLIPHIAQAASLPELAALKTRLAEEAAHIREANRWATTSVRLVSETHLAIQRRAIDLTLDGMQRAGHGAPPVPFVILVMGSGGRREMLLHPDQDNGLILAEVPEAHLPPVQTWFERFGQQLNENLADVGYHLCPGDLMVRNPRYRQTLDQWQAQIDAMIDRPTAEAARWSNIVFDFATLYGDDTLTVALRRHLLDMIQVHSRLLRRMVEDDARGRPALGFFNQLVATTRNATGAHIDLKRHGLRLIADATRILALHAGVAVPNTIDRLAALVRAGRLSEAFSTSVGDAYDAFLDLLLAHQIEQARAGTPPDTLLDLKTLTEQRRAVLRWAMRIVKRLQDRLQETFGVNVYY